MKRDILFEDAVYEMNGEIDLVRLTNNYLHPHSTSGQISSRIRRYKHFDGNIHIEIVRVIIAKVIVDVTCVAVWAICGRNKSLQRGAFSRTLGCSVGRRHEGLNVT